MSKIKKTAMVMLALVMMLSALPVFAFGSSTVRIPSFHVNGWNYRGSVTVATYDATWIEARTWIYTECGRTLNPGIIGASARLYDTRGFVVNSTPMTMNDRITSGIGVGFLHPSPRVANDTRRFYAVGTVRVRNVATGVFTYRHSVRSGIVPRNLDVLPMEERLYWEFNIALDTNGMIPAVSINGLDGWVYAAELHPDLSQGFKYINVYAEDGITAICLFRIEAVTPIYLEDVPYENR